MSNDFENFHVLHKTLGDFWYQWFGGSEQVGTYINALVEMYKQVSQTMRELENSLSRHEIDVFRTYRNYPIKVKYSEFLESSQILPEYDGTYLYNGKIKYSEPIFTAHRIKIPSNIVSVESVDNGVGEVTLSTKDFTLEKGYLTLPWNPFKKDYHIEILSDGEEEVTIWLKNVKLDFDDLYTQYGYILGIKLESSQRYKDIINAYMDCLVNGGSKNNIIKFVKAVTGSEGEFTNDVKGLVLPEGFIGNCLKGQLVLKNELFPITVTEEDGFTRVDLPIEGNKRFKDLCFERGKEKCVEVIDECELSQIREQL